MVQQIEELAYRSATDLAQAMARKDLSPVEVTEACLARIDALDVRVHAFVRVLADEARAAARDSEARIRRGEARPLEGVPIPIKDEIPVAGTATGMGSAGTPTQPAAVDAEVVARLRRAGAIVIGTTHMPEFGTLPCTEHPDGAATRNPWDLERTPGGSSGGAAAAVAAAMVAAAHGRDGGGSLRIPASCCGLFSIKPSRGRVSLAPFHGESPLGLVTDGFITRSVRDCAVLLDTVSGYVAGDPYWAPPPARPFAEEVAAACEPLRIAWTATPPIAVPVQQVCVDAVADAAGLCATLGHHVEQFTPPWESDELLEQFMHIWAAAIGLNVEELIAAGGDVERIEPHNRVLWEQARALPVTAYGMTVIHTHALARRIVAGSAEYDVVLTPTLAEPPLRIGEIFAGYSADPNAAMTRAAMFAPFAATANVTGQPAAQLPLHWSDGLPIGVQAVGRPAEEATLIRLAAQIEAARPWADRRPPLQD